MNRVWAIGIGLAILAGLAILMLTNPVRPALNPEARAMRQLQDASIRPTQVLFLRVSTEDEAVVCGLATADGTSDVRFVSLPERMIIGRRDNPAVQAAASRYCRNAFPAALTAVPQE